MNTRYPPINPKCAQFLHGGDYNPDQWLDTPEIVDEDMRLMKLAGCNAMSVGIFAWSALEPEEGKFTLEWLDDVMDKLAKNQAYAVLATPSGSKPAWMSAAYPEIRIMDADGKRQPHQSRHNHCKTSPVYREKCTIINTKLAQRYKDHPALLVWHVSNEYNGFSCYCDLCLASFREWLKRKYNNDLDKLNFEWWSAFWSHKYTSWEQIEPVDRSIHGMMLDWRRFITWQTIEFYNVETAPLKKYTPHIPATTNFMGLYDGLDYHAFANAVDVVSWDSYPEWHNGDDPALASRTAMTHDLNRSMKGGKPFMLMESVPSFPTRGNVVKRKRPGMHLLSSLQAVAHGSDTVQYFQWRKSRGGVEKLHGAVVDHVGHEHTRVFRDVAAVGDALKKLDAVIGTTTKADVAIVHEWENRWAVESALGLGHTVRYEAELEAYYRPFWNRSVAVDVIGQGRELSEYRLVVAPMLYLLRPGVAARIKQFVAGGGTFVLTYWSGIVNENDLCFTGGFPGDGLREVMGIWDEELDMLHPHEHNSVIMAVANDLKLTGAYEARDLCALIHAEGAEVLATFGADFYAGRPALTVNTLGKGKAYYIASRNDSRFMNDFFGSLVGRLSCRRALETDLPSGVSAQVRSDGKRDYVFVMNFNAAPVSVTLDGRSYTDLLTGTQAGGKLPLAAYGVAVLRR